MGSLKALIEALYQFETAKSDLRVNMSNFYNELKIILKDEVKYTDYPIMIYISPENDSSSQLIINEGKSTARIIFEFTEKDHQELHSQTTVQLRKTSTGWEVRLRGMTWEGSSVQEFAQYFIELLTDTYHQEAQALLAGTLVPAGVSQNE